MSKTVVNSFVSQFMAKIKGDDVQVQAEKVWRQAESALNQSISSLEGDLIDKEDAVERAKENLADARVNNGNPITDRKAYVDGLIRAKEYLKKVQKELDAHNATIEFLKGEHEELKKTV